MKTTETSTVSLVAVMCLLGFVSQLHAQGPYLTITNPAPSIDDRFGHSVAAVGTDRVLVGVPRIISGMINAGAAYLFSSSGSLLTTFTNPTPATDDRFGAAVTAVGPDKVLIGAYGHDTGAYNAGAAFLFSTNGALLTTFTNPTPAAADLFGYAVAAVGADRVLIGAYEEDTGARDTGAVYLFNINGTLLTTFTNPTPQINDWFGVAVAGVGMDKVLIGAFGDNTGASDAGAAYLFATNGTLLTTFTNPTPTSADVEWFGRAVAACGADKVVIGSYYSFAGAIHGAGAAYLFSTNGTLLTTFTNPTPANTDFFGIAVTAVGPDKVLIGAVRDNTGATQTGAAYLFSTNGVLLTTLTNPTPQYFDYFGNSLAALGTDKVIIAARYDDTGAEDAGAVYLFDVLPSLAVSRIATNTLRVSWASAWAGWTLQQTTNLNATDWASPPETVTNTGTTNFITVNSPGGNLFYRLLKP